MKYLGLLRHYNRGGQPDRQWAHLSASSAVLTLRPMLMNRYYEGKGSSTVNNAPLSRAPLAQCWRQQVVYDLECVRSHDNLGFAKVGRQFARRLYMGKNE